MAELDLVIARALVEAGYMPLSAYLKMLEHDAGRHAPLVPSENNPTRNTAPLFLANTES